jgi:hypothetical protein
MAMFHGYVILYTYYIYIIYIYHIYIYIIYIYIIYIYMYMLYNMYIYNIYTYIIYICYIINIYCIYNLYNPFLFHPPAGPEWWHFLRRSLQIELAGHQLEAPGSGYLGLGDLWISGSVSKPCTPGEHQNSW